MIKRTFSRKFSNEREARPGYADTYSNSIDAAARLAKSDLGLGDWVTEATPTRLCLEGGASAFGVRHVDRTVYEGPAEEMRPLLATAAWHTKLRKGPRETKEQAVEMFAALPEEARWPMALEAVALAAEMSDIPARLAFMLACGVEESADLEAGLALEVDALALALHYQDAGIASFHEMVML